MSSDRTYFRCMKELSRTHGPLKWHALRFSYLHGNMHAECHYEDAAHFCETTTDPPPDDEVCAHCRRKIEKEDAK